MKAYQKAVRSEGISARRHWRQPFARWLILLVSTCLFRLVRVYQGPAKVAALVVQGICGRYYMPFTGQPGL